MAGLNAAKITAEPKAVESTAKTEDLSSLSAEEKQKQIKKRNKLIRQIEELEVKQQSGEEMSPDQAAKLARKGTILDRDRNFELFFKIFSISKILNFFLKISRLPSLIVDELKQLEE